MAGRSALAAVLVMVSGVLTAWQESDLAQAFQQLSERPVMLKTVSRSDSRVDEPLRALPEIDRESLRQPVVELGWMLFHDKRLSRDGTLNCASCHGIADGGDDGLRHAIGIDGQTGPINTPNSA